MECSITTYLSLPRDIFENLSTVAVLSLHQFSIVLHLPNLVFRFPPAPELARRALRISGFIKMLFEITTLQDKLQVVKL